jgi:hypothetical protein
MCEEFGPGEIPGPPAPRVTLCYKGKCDNTTVDTICGNAFQSSIQYANGLIISLKEGKNHQPVFTNKNGKKMRGEDWTCEVISTTADKPCKLFNIHSSEPGEE